MAIKAKRITRRPVAESTWVEQDELVEATGKAMTFAQQNRRALIIGGTVTLLVVFGVLGLRAYLSDRTADRSTGFTEALETSTQAVVPPAAAEADEPKEATPEDGSDAKPEPFPTYAARSAAGSKAFASFQSTWGKDGELGLMAQLASAALLLDEGKATEAAAAYQACLSHPEMTTSLRAMALDGLAVAQMSAKKSAEAIATLKELATLEGGLFADYAALQQGRLAEADGKQAEARKLYEAALERSPESPYKDELQKRLDLMGVAG